MLVYSFIAGLFIGAFLGMVLLSLLFAGKQHGVNYDMGPRSQVKHPFVDRAEKDIINKIAYC